MYGIYNINKQHEEKDLVEYNKITRAFGVNPLHLPLEWDTGFIKSIQRLIDQKPYLKDKKVLFLNHPQFKYHEKSILLFLNRKFKLCDCCHLQHRYAGLNVRLENVRYILKKDIFRSFYDYVIVNKGLSFLSKNILKIKAHHFIVLFQTTDIDPVLKNPEILTKVLNSKKKVTFFNLLKNTLHNIYESDPSLKIKASIHWPPSLDLFFRVPENYLFDFLFMGGGGRDYKFVLDNRDLFKGKKVIITHCDAARFYTVQSDRDYDKKYLNLLKKIDNFICLNRINENAYCKLLLYSRIILCPFRRIMGADSTCISDALWYGKPIITNDVKATYHLKEHAFFIKGPEDFKSILNKLNDPAYYMKVTRKIMNYARKEYNIYNLLKLIK
ncbi:MAG: hypothetical protein JW827_11325 [Spirochaetes bacterium]|nr:hypothetical protein [Spirochaetota bacterium]